MRKITLLFASALMALAPLAASAAVRVRVRPPVIVRRAPVVGFGFGYGYRPYWGPSYWGSSYWGPRYYAPQDNTGEVKIDNNKALKEAEVFVNGAYAGLVKDNKTMHFNQGEYKIDVRQGGQTLFSERVFVTAGKTLHINAGS